jgi:hypothetical protein
MNNRQPAHPRLVTQPAPLPSRHDFESIGSILARVFGKHVAPSPRPTPLRLVKRTARP